MAFLDDVVTGELEPPTDEEIARVLFLMADQQWADLRTLLWLIQESKVATAQVDRLWGRVVDAGLRDEGASGVLAAMEIADQLDDLKGSVDQRWTNPADVLDPEGEKGVDLDALLNLAQAQLADLAIADQALGTVVARILEHLELIQEKH